MTVSIGFVPSQSNFRSWDLWQCSSYTVCAWNIKRILSLYENLEIAKSAGTNHKADTISIECIDVNKFFLRELNSLLIVYRFTRFYLLHIYNNYWMLDNLVRDESNAFLELSARHLTTIFRLSFIVIVGFHVKNDFPIIIWCNSTKVSRRSSDNLEKTTKHVNKSVRV